MNTKELDNIKWVAQCLYNDYADKLQELVVKTKKPQDFFNNEEEILALADFINSANKAIQSILWEQEEVKKKNV